MKLTGLHNSNAYVLAAFIPWLSRVYLLKSTSLLKIEIFAKPLIRTDHIAKGGHTVDEELRLLVLLGGAGLWLGIG